MVQAARSGKQNIAETSMASATSREMNKIIHASVEKPIALTKLFSDEISNNTILFSNSFNYALSYDFKW